MPYRDEDGIIRLYSERKRIGDLDNSIVTNIDVEPVSRKGKQIVDTVGRFANVIRYDAAMPCFNGEPGFYVEFQFNGTTHRRNIRVHGDEHFTIKRMLY